MKIGRIERADLFRRHLFPGVDAELAWGERIMLSVVTIEPDGVVPVHSHPHEQAGLCVEGEFDLEVEGKTERIRAGDLYLIPGKTPHAARGVGVRAVTLDIFSPPREEYKPGGGGPGSAGQPGAGPGNAEATGGDPEERAPGSGPSER